MHVVVFHFLQLKSKCVITGEGGSTHGGNDGSPMPVIAWARPETDGGGSCQKGSNSG